MADKKEIKKVVNVPLVLHGGSGNPDKEIGEAAKLGINKINISSDIKDAHEILHCIPAVCLPADFVPVHVQ